MPATSPALDYATAKKLAKALLGRVATHRFDILVEAVHSTGRRGTTTDYLIIFTGGNNGNATLWASTSTAERMEAHFEGYVQANGFQLRKYAVDDRVVFPSASSPTGTRAGRILKVTPTRVLVEFRYKTNPKHPAQKWVSKLDIVRFSLMLG